MEKLEYNLWEQESRHKLPLTYLFIERLIISMERLSVTGKCFKSSPSVTHSFDLSLWDAVEPSIVIHVLFHCQQVIQGIFLRTVAKE